MSPLLTSILTALGIVLVGLACGALLHRQQRQLDRACQRVAAAEQRAARAEELAGRDDTTGLPNRRAFLDQLAQALAAGAATGVVLLDLDDFKTVNDTYGHECGNDLLTGVGLRLCDLPPPVRFVARLSGDEFALLVAGDIDQTRAAARAAWRAVAAKPVSVTDQHEIPVRASVGYANATADHTARTLLNEADLAMYHAKRTGTGVYNPATVQDTTLPPRTRYRDLRRGNQPRPPAPR